jgi:hypothetical protein
MGSASPLYTSLFFSPELTLDISVLAETKLVPTLQHSTPIIEFVRGFLPHLDDERAVLGRDLTGVVPLHVTGGPVYTEQGCARRG